MGRRRSSDDEYLERQFLKLPPKAQAAIAILVVVVFLVGFAMKSIQSRPSAGSSVPGQVAAVGSGDLLLGNPSNATADPSNRTNYLMVKKYFTLSYNDEKGIPNWVSWCVTASDLGEAPRKQIFDPDDTLPADFHRVQNRDYSQSGYDRGHMCPHSDRGANEEMSFATFVLTNIVPQAPNVNRKTWAKLEDYCRELVRKGNRLYIIAGPAGQGGVGEFGKSLAIAGGTISVPGECWKIVVVVPDSGADNVAAIDRGTRVIAVMMPNSQEIGEEWSAYVTSVSAIEAKTGYHFFTSLPANVAAELRTKVDGGWTR